MNPDTEKKDMPKTPATTAPAAPLEAGAPAASFAPRRDERPRGGAGGGRGGRGGPRKGDSRAPRAKPEFDSVMLNIRRVARTVSGGRRFSFSVALVAGDRKGKVG